MIHVGHLLGRLVGRLKVPLTRIQLGKCSGVGGTYVGENEIQPRSEHLWPTLHLDQLCRIVRHILRILEVVG